MEPGAYGFLKRNGKSFASLRAVNALPPEIKARVYASLIPPDLFSFYQVDPVSFLDRGGQTALQVDCPPGQGRVKLHLKRSASETDPVVFIQLSDTLYDQVEFEWVILNDPDSERFQIHASGRNQFLPPGSENRNIPEEIRAMEAGLAPGQIRKGLRKFPEIMDRLETFLMELNLHLVYGYPYAYHNAIELERIGYFYGTGKEQMVDIDRDFNRAGNCLTGWMDRLPSDGQAWKRRSGGEAGPSTTASWISAGSAP
jgi:hypothetical protein